jgi:5'(3')-deoxyribonucleotidase
VENEKNLVEFLKILIDLTQDNIDFIKGKQIFLPAMIGKYENELRQIRDLINSFDFVK